MTNHTAQHFLPIMGYTVEVSSPRADKVRFAVMERVGDSPSTAGVFAPWVKSAFLSWFHLIGPPFLAASARVSYGGPYVTFAGITNHAREETKAALAMMFTSQIAVVPRALTEAISEPWGTAPRADYHSSDMIDLILASLSVMDFGRAAALQKRKTLRVEVALQAWAEAYEAQFSQPVIRPHGTATF